MQALFQLADFTLYCAHFASFRLTLPAMFSVVASSTNHHCSSCFGDHIFLGHISYKLKSQVISRARNIENYNLTMTRLSNLSFKYSHIDLTLHLAKSSIVPSILNTSPKISGLSNFNRCPSTAHSLFRLINCFVLSLLLSHLTYLSCLLPSLPFY